MRHTLEYQSFRTSYDMEDEVLFCELTGDYSLSTLPFFSKEGFSKPAPGSVHIGCCSLWGQMLLQIRKSLRINPVRHQPDSKRHCLKRYSHYTIHSTVPWPSCILGCWTLSIEGVEQNLKKKCQALGSTVVGKLLVGCPWSEDDLLLSKPNSLLLEWVSPSRCPRLTKMPR